MAQPVIALQLYGVRKHMADAEGTVASLQKVADIGYKWVEVAGLGGMTAPDFAAACEDIGLQIISSHESWEELCSNPEAAIEKCKTLGLKFVASGSPRDYHSAEGYAKFAEETTPMAQALAAAGITYMYHNHAHEYAAFGGRTGMEIMAENGDPEYFRFQLDVHWVQRGGASPVAWLNKLGSRIATLHCKDMGVTPQSEPLFEPVGTGNLDWPGIIAAAQEAGIGYYIVEQDTCQLDEFESAAISYDNLEEWLG